MLGGMLKFRSGLIWRGSRAGAKTIGDECVRISRQSAVSVVELPARAPCALKSDRAIGPHSAVRAKSTLVLTAAPPQSTGRQNVLRCETAE